MPDYDHTPKVTRALPIPKIGGRFGRLTVIGPYCLIPTRYNANKRHGAMPCRCDCGKEIMVMTAYLFNGDTRSCGCLRKEMRIIRNTKHGEYGTRLHRMWQNIHSRCKHRSKREYKDYGGRGIRVCDQWSDFNAFRDWALANGYRDNLSIERKDVNGHYEPSNCTFIPLCEQINNRRKTVRITAFGETKLATEWAKDPRCCVGVNALRRRLKEDRWNNEDIISKLK